MRKREKLYLLIGSTALPVLAAFLCDILFAYLQNQELLFYLVGGILVITNLSLFLNAMVSKMFGPFFLSLFCSALIMTSFYYESVWHVSFGIFGLFVAAVLNILQIEFKKR